MNRLPHCLFRLIADSWREVNEIPSVLVLGPPRPKGITQKVKTDIRVITPPIIVLAIHDTCFGQMELQATFHKPLLQTALKVLRFLEAAAMRHSVISIA